MNGRIAILFLVLCTANLIEAQQTLNESLSLNGVERDYIVYVPATYDEDSATPLMFNFHGYGMTANDQMTWGGDMRPVADTAGFVLVYPQGRNLWGQPHWNVGSWTVGSPSDDLGFTEAMIDSLAANYNIDLERVYSCGYSNGGYFSFELACKMSDRIAAIGSVAGTMSNQTLAACDPSHPTPVVTIHGTADIVVNYNGGIPVNSQSIEDVNSYWSMFNNTTESATVSDLPNTDTTDGSTVELSIFENGDNCVSVGHYKIVGGNHDWPGLWGNMDIHASSLIWSFVSKYDINGLIKCNSTATHEGSTALNNIKVYPNPFHHEVTIEIESPSIDTYKIYSKLGELVATGVFDSKQSTINLSLLPPNIYFLKTGNKIVKLVKVP